MKRIMKLIKYLFNDKIFKIYFKIILITLLIENNIVLGELNFNNDVDNNKNFDSAPTTIKTYENDTVLLPCYLNAAPKFVRWNRDEVLIADSRHPEVPPPERYHFWPNGSLQVSNVKSEDTGEYYCEVMTANSQHVVQMHAIEVQYKPIVVISPTGLFEVPVKSLFEVVCEAKGVPLPIISWKGEGIHAPATDRSENLRKLFMDIKSRNQSGLIECFAENGVGEPVSAGFYLNVLFPPEVRVVTSIVHTKINTRAHIECIVTSAPAAKVHWFHHGVPIIPDTRIARHDTEIQSNRSYTHYITESKHQLVIKKITEHDLGIYECRAENKIGFKGEKIELTGRPMPCVFKSSPIQQMGTTHNLIWQTESLSPISEYKLKFRQIPSGNVTPQNRPIIVAWNELTIPAGESDGSIHTATYTLRGLLPASVYEVAVLAKNRFGWSENSKIVRFATGGEVELNYSTETLLLDYNDEVEDNFLPEDYPKVEVQVYSASIGGSSNSFSNIFYKNISSLIITLNALTYILKSLR